MSSFTKFVKHLSALSFAGLFTLHVNAQNRALDFDGTSDYVDIPYNSTYMPLIKSIQISAKVAGNAGHLQSVLTAGGNVSGYGGFGLYAVTDDYWYILFGTGGGSWVTLKGPKINYGTWTNLAGTYDGTTFKFYVNGVLENSVVTTFTPNPSLPIRLGAGNNEGASPDYYLKGQTDELSIWNKLLTATDITNNIGKALVGNESGLIAYYNFNEGIGNGDNTSPAVDKLNDLTSHALNGTLYTFTLNGLTSNWVISSLILPINLINFEGSNKAGSNYLQWSTASEQNSSYFEIQRSNDGVNFTDIAKVDASGNSDKTLNYSYSDNQLSSIASVYYYRLKMVDIDGTSKYSSIINIKNSAIALAKVFPNPVSSQFTITIKDNSLLNTKVTLNDISGKVLQKITITQPNTKVNISNYLSGVYILKFEDGKSVKVIKE